MTIASMGTVSGVRVKLKSTGVVKLLKDANVHASLVSRADSIAAALPVDKGEEWAVQSFMGKDRMHVMVRTKNSAARKTNSKDHSLVRALDAGR